MILILNCGSQSIKWKLFDNSLELEKEGNIRVFGVRDYEKTLLSEFAELKPFQKYIKIIGHRFVHGGKNFKSPTKITKANFKKLEELAKLAPLHNPYNILGIKFSQSIFPKAKQVVVFDTEFFADLPEKASVYSLPKKYGVSKFGFHGISHEYAAKQASEMMQKSIKSLKIITCHLGGGSSITAIDKGKPVDTSMGFTPLGGAVMMTRPGDMDPGAILHLMGKTKNIESILNYESGLKAICGLSDMKDILKAVKGGNENAKLALDVFVYSIQKYIGSYFAILGGCDLLVFTGAIGSGSAKIVDMICKNLVILKNTKVLSVKPNEELAIAQKIKNLK